MRLLPLWLLVTLCIAGCTSMGGGIEQDDWYRYQSSHFQVYSPLREARVAERIRDLEAFRALVHHVLGIPDARSFEHTTKFLLLPHPRDVNSVFRLPRGMIGFMQTGTRQNLMVATEPGHHYLNSANEVMFHEYVHYVMHNASSFRYPGWYDEGFAEVLATANIEEESANLGHAPRSAAYVLLRGAGMMPVDELVSRGVVGGLSTTGLQQLYATSWLLVHYLTLSEAAREHGLGDKAAQYLALYNSGRGGPEAFQETLGVDFHQLEKDLVAYQGTLPLWALPLSSIEFDGAYERQRLAAEEIAYELGYMVVETYPDYARKLFTSILDKEPDNARALAGLGVSHQFDGEHDQAERLMREALTVDEQDHLLHTELADLLRIRCRHDAGTGECTDAAVNREAEALYRRAYELNPDSAETIGNYGTILLDNDNAERALPLLEKAYHLLPSNYGLVLSLGLALAATGDLDAARMRLRQAAGWAVDEPEEHARVTALLEQLDTPEGVE